jgi:hypothetical protein
MKRISFSLDRPHPGPLSREREDYRQPVGETGAVRIFINRALRFPLSGGAGRRATPFPQARPNPPAGRSLGAAGPAF